MSEAVSIPCPNCGASLPDSVDLAAAAEGWLLEHGMSEKALNTLRDKLR